MEQPPPGQFVYVREFHSRFGSASANGFWRPLLVPS